jgi:hypothetical protein
MQVLVGLALMVASVAFIAILIARVLRRTGFSPWLAFVAIVPVFNVVCLWVFAFSDWPSEVVNPRERDKWSPAENEAFKKALANQKRGF